MDNEKLTGELAPAKKKCEELVAYLQGDLNIGAEQINHILGKGTNGSSHDTDDDDDNVVRECLGFGFKGKENI
jgi:heat shock transcription factor, other eukaryote